VRDFDLLVPATTESLVEERHAAAREAALAAADAWRVTFDTGAMAATDGAGAAADQADETDVPADHG